MAVQLFTVRIILNTLGVVDYGIQNVVGGIVVMCSFLSDTMASASQRFFAFEIGRKDNVQLKRTFSMTIIIYAIIAVIILLLAETVGLWFLNNKLVIPHERMVAANWVYQFSILSFIVTIMTIPYVAAIIAYENMKVFAYVSILEVVLKLLVVYMLVWFTFDKFKMYALLLFITTIITTFTYRTICKQKYEECRFRFYWEKKLFNTLIGYSGWNLFGAIASILNNQGINILLNLFFGPTVNAARAIAFQVNSSVNQFVMNFFKAVQPQITKHYAANENEKMLHLVFQGSKISFFLLLIISMPLLLETKYILTLWLKETPEYVVIFTRLVIITALVDSLSYALQTAAQATGKIKLYQTVVGGAMLLNLPTSYIFLHYGYAPEITMVIALFISVACLSLRLWILTKLIDLSLILFLKDVLSVALFTAIISYLLPIFLFIQLNEGVTKFFVIVLVGLITTTLSIYFIGLKLNERRFMLQIIQNKLLKKFN